MKKVTIAGGGISGLVARYYLTQKFPAAEIVLVEKSGRLGGCIASTTAPFFFEKGPRTCKISRGKDLLDLIEEVGLKEAVITSDKKSHRRYLWKRGKLRALTPFSPLVYPLIRELALEWQKPQGGEKDESIAAFATRRLGPYAAATFFDPLTLGIFAGNSHQLSLAASFPELKAMEQEHGSLTRAIWNKRKRPTERGLFSLEGGLQTLIDRLVERGRGKILLCTPLSSLPREETIIALPASAARSLFLGNTKIQGFFNGIGAVDLTVVHIAYRGDLLRRKGFGYLIPSSERENILGVVFDSAIFPTQNRENKETRLTVMLRQGGVKEAIEGVRRHLAITAMPAAIDCTEWKEAIPQYRVGHLERVKDFEKEVEKHYPHVKCIGNYLTGPSVNRCIQLARAAATL